MVPWLHLYKKADKKKKKKRLVEKLHSSTATVSEAIFDIYHPPSPPLILSISQVCKLCLPHEVN